LPAPWLPQESDAARPLLTPGRYLIGIIIIFASAYGQYLVSGLSLALGAFFVYGVSIIAIALLYRAPVARRAFRHTTLALKLGLGYFGFFTVLATAATLIVTALLLDIAPKALNRLQKPVPGLTVPPRLAWIMVGASMVVVGPCEEYIFRGFVFGGLLSLFGERRWLLMAFVSSLLFAVVHLYYALVYGVAALIPFISILAIGMALAITYYKTGGNLMIPALIHGVYDATGFLTVAVSTHLGARMRGIFVIICITVAVLAVIDEQRKRARVFW
jgi:membrane protease YdiL (CAAX protease family)